MSEVHGGLMLRQAPVIRDYVQFNLLRHSQAWNDFYIDFYKLLSNSLFSKMIENPEKRTKVKLCRTKEGLESSVGRATFKRSKIIHQHLVGVEMKNALVKLNKPYYVGVAILELTKCRMYDFHYDVMKSVMRVICVYCTWIRIHYYMRSRTVLILIRRFLQQDMARILIFLIFRRSIGCMIYHVNVFRVLSKMSVGGSTYISEFVGLHSKMYSLLFDNGSTQTCTESKVVKGVKSCVIRTSLTFNDYICCMLEDKVMEHLVKTIRSVAHNVHTFEQSKVLLSPFDDKCYLCSAFRSLRSI